MEDVVFNQLENAINALLDRVDQLKSENEVLQRELERLRTDHHKEADLIAGLQQEKNELTKQFQNSQLGHVKGEQIKTYIDNILRKLDELQVTLQ